jgi:uncharacterized protein Usg
MKITFDPQIAAKTGDFGDAIGGELHVAEALRAAFRQFGISTAEVLYDIAASDPGVLANALEWSEADVAAATRDLEISLKQLGRIDLDRAIDPPHFGTGAGPVYKYKF